MYQSKYRFIFIYTVTCLESKHDFVNLYITKSFTVFYGHYRAYFHEHELIAVKQICT